MVSDDLADPRRAVPSAQPVRVLDAAGSEIPAPDWITQGAELPAGADTRGVVIVLLKADQSAPVRLIRQLGEEATTVVLGPAERSDWRREALAAGAFACMSPGTAFDDRDALLFAAIQQQAARVEIQNLRLEANRICLELVQSFVAAMEKLGLAKRETQRVLDALEQARLRILQTLI